MVINSSKCEFPKVSQAQGNIPKSEPGAMTGIVRWRQADQGKWSDDSPRSCGASLEGTFGVTMFGA